MTLKVQVERSLSLSSIIHTTFVFPIANSDPEGGIHMTSIFVPLPFLIDGFFHTTIAVGLVESVDTSIFAGQKCSEDLRMSQYS